MEATDWIAGYAAVVATAAFGWEVWKTIGLAVHRSR